MVIFVTRSARRRANLIAVGGNRGMVGVMVRIVVVGGRALMVMGHRLDRRRMLRGLARHAHTQPRVEVAAAERHRYREQQGDEQPECAAALKRAQGEYIGLTVIREGSQRGSSATPSATPREPDREIAPRLRP